MKLPLIMHRAEDQMLHLAFELDATNGARFAQVTDGNSMWAAMSLRAE